MLTATLHQFPNLEVVADATGLRITSSREGVRPERRETWPAENLQAARGWKTAIEIEQLVELGLAEPGPGAVSIPYRNFDEIDSIQNGITSAWTLPSPFLLKIDRRSDLGRSDFLYKYNFLSGGIPIWIERLGYYLRREGENRIFRLDQQTYALVEAMDRFNALPPDQKTTHESWLTLAKVKGSASEVGADLDSVLRANDVVVPSSIGLDIYEDEGGRLTFLPRCPELANEDFRNVFERNPEAQSLYSLDQPGLGRVRIVLSDTQQEVLRRMKRVRRLTGPLKESVRQNPAQVFDGILDSVELPYSDRVIGIGDFQFVPVPRSADDSGNMAGLWKNPLGAAVDKIESQEPQSGAETTGNAPPTETAHGPLPSACAADSGGIESKTDISAGENPVQPTDDTTQSRRKFLLIKTNEEQVESEAIAEAERAAALFQEAPFQKPTSLNSSVVLQRHQVDGVRWLQTCRKIGERRGVLLADDMGLGKTLQVLTFLAWGIESGQFPDLSSPTPPYRPILIIVPLILLEDRTWESTMERFFDQSGSVFRRFITLHSKELKSLRSLEAEGRETEIGKPILEMERLKKYRVVITNYETITNYQYSFAYMPNGISQWSAIVTDEAQEYKTPNTRISHAIKALKADFHVASTGTPVENRLLDLWNLFDALQQGVLGSAHEFRQTYEDQLGTDSRGQILDGLKRKLLFQRPHAFILRRDKSEIADLPPKHTKKMFSPMSEGEIARHRELIQELRGDSHAAHHLTILHRLALLYQHPALEQRDAEDFSAAGLIQGSSKLRVVIDLLHEIRNAGEKAIVFTRHRTMQSILAKVTEFEFRMPVRIINGLTQRTTGSGKRGNSTRAAILDEFRSQPGFGILILSPFVAGVGLTITEANHVIHYGRWWNPAVESQATDRTYRIGQTRPVHVYLPILHDPSGTIPTTFDQRLDALMERRYRLAEDFLRPLPDEAGLGQELAAELSDEASGDSGDSR
jgi:hypothetical protein